MNATQSKTDSVRRVRPLADVYESETAYRIEIDLVAVNREQIAISVDKNTLKVSAERTPAKAEGESEAAAQLAAAVSTVPSVVYERDFTLPTDVDRDALGATYVAGVLGITIPKQAKETPRKVPVAN